MHFMHFRMTARLIYSWLPLCDDIILLSLFLPYLCLSSGGATTSALAALRQAHMLHSLTHTHAQASAEVHVLYNLQEVIRGFEIKGFVQRENIPPFPLGDKRTDSFLMLTLKQPLCYKNPDANLWRHKIMWIKMFYNKLFFLRKKIFSSQTPVLSALLGRILWSVSET